MSRFRYALNAGLGLGKSPTFGYQRSSVLWRARQIRFTASSVSGQPASKDFPSAARNAREEASNVASDLAKTISGGQAGNLESLTDITREKGASSRGHGQGLGQDFVSITSAIAAHVPKHVFVMGLAGALPYLGTSLSTLYLARQAAQASTGIITTISPESAIALLDTCTSIQVTYGAVMLSFLGALHWGMEFAGFGGSKGYPRLFLGMAPLLAVWPTLALEPHLALSAQWLIFTGLWFADMKVTNAGWTPKWYSQYRFYLSILVGTCILSTLFGLNYLGPTTDVAIAQHLENTGGLGSTSTLMDRNVRDEKALKKKDSTLPEDAEVKTSAGDDQSEGYVKLVKRKEASKGGEAEESGDEESTNGGNGSSANVGSPAGGNTGGPGENKTSAQDKQREIKTEGSRATNKENTE